MNSKGKKENKKRRPASVEIGRRQAAGLAAATKGMSRVFKDKSKYDRKAQPKAKGWA